MIIRIRNNIYKIISFIVLGSGIVNVLSASGRPLLVRKEILLNIFPLEFLQLSNFLTLILGISLAVTAINLYKKKANAYYLAVFLSLSSFVLHLTKGLDIEEAFFSAITALLLLFTRKEYYVKSEIFNLKLTILKILLSFFLLLIYGILGFWLLDKRDFGINFSLINSLQKTLIQMSFSYDPQLIAKTRYARFFLHSLRGAMILILVYTLKSLFTPILFRFTKNPNDNEKAKKLLDKYSICSLDFFKLWPDKSYFFSSDNNSFISYGVSSNIAVSLGDPVGKKESFKIIIKEFINYCKTNGWSYAFHQVLPNFLNKYKGFGLKHFKIGDEAYVDLSMFTLVGSEAKNFRNIINKFNKDGYQAILEYPPINTNLLQNLKEISDDWLKIGGRRERTFTLGQFDKDYISSSSVLVIYDKNKIPIAFANIIYPFTKGEVTIDLMRHRRNSPNSTMEYLFINLFSILKEKGFLRFSLGLAPMSGFSTEEKSTFAEKATHSFAKNLNFIFSFKGLKQFKAKFANKWEPRYLIYKNTTELPFIAKALNELATYPKK